MADTTYQPAVYRKQGGDELVVADGGKILVESGGTIEVESGGTMTIADGAFAVGDLALTTGSIIIGAASKGSALDAKGDGEILIGNGTTAAMKSVSGDATLANTGELTIGAKKVTAAKIAIADGKIFIGGADGAAAEQTLTGDVTVTNAGVTAIGAGKVTNAMLANGAGVAALLTAGLGGSVSVTKTDAATTTIVAAHDTKDRACLVLVVVDETYDVGTGTLPTVKIGEDDNIEKAMAATVLDTEAAGTVLAFAFTNTATKKIIVTTTAAVGDATGGCSITVLAIPTT
ncbi:MAG TPA: hypothetical protein PL061_13540 [Syntrophales bacterium]|mgnify:FL=1|nr:hypothetical protein [Syntrophales bacterium]